MTATLEDCGHACFVAIVTEAETLSLTISTQLFNNQIPQKTGAEEWGINKDFWDTDYRKTIPIFVSFKNWLGNEILEDYSAVIVNHVAWGV